MTSSTRLYLLALALAASLAGLFHSQALYGPAYWLATGLGVTGLFASSSMITGALGRHVIIAAVARTLRNIAVVTGSTFAALVVAESALLVLAHAQANAPALDAAGPQASLVIPGTLSPGAVDRLRQRRGLLTLPVEWRRREVHVDGSVSSFLWHDALHVHDAGGFRRTAPFPPRAENTFRIVVVGDSLTYGYGIAEAFAYPALIQAHLAREYRVEVLNLGLSGRQSEDILGVLRRHLPLLRPDAVVYGVCLNDFLPSGRSQGQAVAYPFPLPEDLQAHLIHRSRLAALVSDGYGQLLLQTGLRKDFMDDIVSGLDGYQARFGRDVAGMARLASEAEGVALLAMVLHQAPRVAGRSQAAARIAERHLRDAGFTVVDSAPYFDAYDGRLLTVSRWEGHPNELAHAVFASMLIPAITALPELQPYRVTDRGGRAAHPASVEARRQ